MRSGLIGKKLTHAESGDRQFEIFEIRDGHDRQGFIDQSSWDHSLTADGLRSSMWLYAYESVLKNLNSTRSKGHVTSDPYFGPLLAQNIEFYRSGSFHKGQTPKPASAAPSHHSNAPIEPEGQSILSKKIAHPEAILSAV